MANLLQTTNTKHTPGPWTLLINKEGGNWDWAIRTVKPHNPAGEIGIHIAEVNRFLPEVEANAHLIAAAPEMFAALEAILFQIVQGKVLERDACITAARAAIAKAKGGE